MQPWLVRSLKLSAKIEDDILCLAKILNAIFDLNPERQFTSMFLASFNSPILLSSSGSAIWWNPSIPPIYICSPIFLTSRW